MLKLVLNPAGTIDPTPTLCNILSPNTIRVNKRCLGWWKAKTQFSSIFNTKIRQKFNYTRILVTKLNASFCKCSQSSVARSMRNWPFGNIVRDHAINQRLWTTLLDIKVLNLPPCMSLDLYQERLEDKNVLLANIGAISCRVHCSKLHMQDVNCEITLILILKTSRFN